MPQNFTDVNIGLGNGFVAWRHQAITWVNVNPVLCRHMVLLGHIYCIAVMTH